MYGILVFLVLGAAGIPFLKENICYEEAVTTEYEEGTARTEVLGKTYALERGIYQIKVYYEAGSTNNYVFAVSEQRPERVGCDRTVLERAKNQEVFYTWISGHVDDFQVVSEYMGAGSFSVSRIEIQQMTLGKVRDLFMAAVLCLLLFTLCVIVQKGLWKEKNRARTITALAGIAVLASVPLVTEGLYIGHDSGFHLNRIEGIWQGLASGQFPVRIQPNWLHGYGYAVSVFYGDILLYFPAALRLLGFSVQEAYECFVFAVNIATAGISWWCWKRMFQDENVALAGSFLYTLSLYRLVNVYTRAAVGEYCAMMFLPLVVYGFWCILSEQGKKKNWVPLMLGYTGLLQTHLLSCEIVGLFSVILCLAMIKRVWKKENQIALLKAATGTLLLNTWFLIPFLDYMWKETLKINTEILAGNSIQSIGLSVEQLIQVFQHGTGLEKGMPLGIGLGLQIGLILLMAVWLRYRKRNRKAVFPGFLLLFAGLAVFCATKYFPWDILIDSGLGFLASLQFPWRFLGIATVLLCTGVCSALLILKQDEKRMITRFCTALLIAGTVLSSGYLMATFMDSAELEACYEQRDAPYYVSGGEYMPADVTFSEDAFHPLEPAGEEIQIEWYEKRYNQICVLCRNEREEENLLRVPILLYRGYRSSDKETGAEFSMVRMENGMTGILLPAGYSGTVCMRFQEPFYWRLAELLSFLTGVAMIAFFRKEPMYKSVALPAI